MSIVNIHGVIMPDNMWLEDNVATLTQFQQELNECTDSLELYIDSPGGDVMTSNSMSAMLAEWVLNNPNKKCKCIVGGLCASAAFNIVAKLPSSFAISCFEDSLFMAHSCYAMVMGGPDALRDNATLMDLVNSVVIDKLISKTTLDETRIRTAFKEGREMWLDGKEAVACGLANEIRGGQAETTVITATFKNTNAEAYKYAACVTNTIRTKLEAHMAEENKPTVEETETKEETQEAKAEVVAEAVEPEEEEAKAECGDEKEPKAEDTEEPTEEEEPKAEEDDEEMKALKAENEALKAEIENLKSVIAKYTPTATPTAKAVKADWLTMVKELNSQHLPEQAYAQAYSKLKADHKEEFTAFMSQHTIR